MSTFMPAYLSLGRDELRARATAAVASLADCGACPRDCRVNRLEDAWSACKTGRHAEARRMAADLGLRRLDERRPHPRLTARFVFA